MLIFFRRATVTINGVEKVVAQKYYVYLDQIMQGYNKQSALAVLAMIECCLRWTAENLPDILSVIVQSDQAACYQANLTKVGIALLNMVWRVRVERYVHSGVQDGKGLLDAHFSRALAHVLGGLRNLSANRTSKIATTRGLAQALARPGLSNAAVQLVELNLAKLAAIEAVIAPAAKVLQPYFSRCGEIEYPAVVRGLTWEQVIQKLRVAGGVVLPLTAFAYSSIDGTSFKITLTRAIGAAAPTASLTATRLATGGGAGAGGSGAGVGGGSGGSGGGGSEGGDIAALEQEEEEKEEEEEQKSAEEEEDVEVDDVGAVTEMARLMEEQDADDKECARARRNDDDDDDDNGDGRGDDDDDDHIDNNDDDDDDNDGIKHGTRRRRLPAAAAAAPTHAAGGNGDGELVDVVPLAITQSLVLKETKVLQLRGQCVASDRHQPPPVAAGDEVRRWDLVACGVRLAAELITSHSLVRDKRAVFAEFDLAAGFAVEEHHQGWGRQPPKGKTYGETYITEFHAEITAMYQKGKVDKNAKVSPDQVREALRLRYPHRFTLPGVWAIQTLFISLGQKKAGALEGVLRPRGRASQLPAAVQVAIQTIVAANPAIKPAAALAAVLVQCPGLDKELHKKVASRVSSVKSAMKPKKVEKDIKL